MAKTYSQIVKEIETLKMQADALRAKEVVGVVEQIRKAVAAYGLTAEDLGLGGRSGPRSSVQIRKPSGRKGAKAKAAPVAKYRDDAGNTWVGRGPRPRWLTTALAAGHSLESFAANGGGAASTPDTEGVKPASKAPARKPLKLVSKPKFQDGAGNTWTGRGPRPGWLKAAIAAGRSIDELAA